MKIELNLLNCGQKIKEKKSLNVFVYCILCKIIQTIRIFLSQNCIFDNNIIYPYRAAIMSCSII